MKKGKLPVIIGSSPDYTSAYLTEDVGIIKRLNTELSVVLKYRQRLNGTNQSSTSENVKNSGKQDKGKRIDLRPTSPMRSK